MSYFSHAFLAAAAERAIKTFAQTLAALLAAGGSGILDADWGGRLSIAAMAAVVSLLTSVASGGVGAAGPSLAGEGLVPSAAGGSARSAAASLSPSR
jgi:hypothetical protein